MIHWLPTVICTLYCRTICKHLGSHNVHVYRMYLQCGLWIGLMMARWAATCCQIYKQLFVVFRLNRMILIFRTLCINPLPRLITNVRFFLQSPPLFLQRQSKVSPTWRLEYYDVAWGLTKVLKEKGLAAVRFKASLPSGSAQFERHNSEVSKLSVLWPHAFSVHE